MTVHEVVVVGGGAVGASIAWQLGRSGRQVHWLAGTQGAPSATSASGAMLSVHSELVPDAGSSADDEVAARAEGRRLWDDWLPRLSDECGTPLTCVDGITVVASSAQDVRTLEAIRDAATRDDAKPLDVDPRDVPGLAPDVGAEAVAAVTLPLEAGVDSAQLLQALRLAASRCVEVQDLDAVALSLAPHEVAVTCSDGSTTRGAHVVLAAGIGTTALLDRSGLASLAPTVLGGRGVSMLVRSSRPLPATVRTPNRAFSCGLHAVPRGDGRTYLGATNRLTLRPELHGAPQLSELHDLVSGCVRELDRGLRSAEVVATSVGFRPVTLDRLPLVGRTAERRVLLATATWRNGVVLAPHLAQLVESELDAPGSTAAHPFAATRRLQVPDLDEALTHRAARGIVESILGTVVTNPGRAQELVAALERLLTGQLQDPSGPAARVLRTAPMEEALPLVLELLLRQRTS